MKLTELLLEDAAAEISDRSIFTLQELRFLQKWFRDKLKENNLSTNKAAFLLRWLSREVRTKAFASKYVNHYSQFDGEPRMIAGEDLGLITRELILFLKHRVGDLNTIHYYGLYDKVSGIMQRENEKQNSEIAKKESQRFEIGKRWLVIIPRTYNACTVYGAGTRWCIASRDYEDKFWNSYTNNGEYPVYIIIDRENGNAKYAFIFQAKEFRDAADEEIEPAELMDKDLLNFFVDRDEIKEFEMRELKYGSLSFRASGGKFFLYYGITSSLCLMFSLWRGVIKEILNDNFKWFSQHTAPGLDSSKTVYLSYLNPENFQKVAKIVNFGHPGQSLHWPQIMNIISTGISVAMLTDESVKKQMEAQKKAKKVIMKKLTAFLGLKKVSGKYGPKYEISADGFLRAWSGKLIEIGYREMFTEDFNFIDEKRLNEYVAQRLKEFQES